MSLPPFQDGFPNEVKSAINASYFLSDDDKTEWNDWLKSADAQQQDELINILHTMWEEAQKQGNTGVNNANVPTQNTSQNPIQDLPQNQSQSQLQTQQNNQQFQPQNQLRNQATQSQFGQNQQNNFAQPQNQPQFGQPINQPNIQQNQPINTQQFHPQNPNLDNLQPSQFGNQFGQDMNFQNQSINQNQFGQPMNQQNNQQMNQSNQTMNTQQNIQPNQNPFQNPQAQNPYMDNNYGNQQSQLMNQFGNFNPQYSQSNPQSNFTPNQSMGMQNQTMQNQEISNSQNSAPTVIPSISAPVQIATTDQQVEPQFTFAKNTVQNTTPNVIDHNIFTQPETKYTTNPLLNEIGPKIEPKPFIIKYEQEEEPQVETKIELKEEIKPEPKVETKTEDEFVFDNTLDAKTHIETTSFEDLPIVTKTEEKSKRRSASASIDFTNIRENVRKDMIIQLKEDYVQTRDANANLYGQFVEKVTEVLCEFEDVNDYIEAMTDKVLSMNDEVISQASDIQALKNATQNRGASLQDQIDEVRYDLEKILKEIRNVRIEMKRSNDEIRQRLSILEADSFRQENDGINQKLTIMKSEISRLQEVITINTMGMPQAPQSQSDMNSNARISKLDTISFKKK